MHQANDSFIGRVFCWHRLKKKCNKVTWRKNFRLYFSDFTKPNTNQMFFILHFVFEKSAIIAAHVYCKIAQSSPFSHLIPIKKKINNSIDFILDLSSSMKLERQLIVSFVFQFWCLRAIARKSNFPLPRNHCNGKKTEKINFRNYKTVQNRKKNKMQSTLKHFSKTTNKLSNSVCHFNIEFLFTRTSYQFLHPHTLFNGGIIKRNITWRSRKCCTFFKHKREHTTMGMNKESKRNHHVDFMCLDRI